MNRFSTPRRGALSRHRAPLIAVAALALAGCDVRTPPTQKGELSDGVFTYLCVGSSDALCDQGASSLDGFPPVAVGSEFSVDFAPETATSSDGTEVFSYIDTVAPERIEIVGDPAADPPTLRAHEVGFTALIAKGDYGSFDLLHVEVAPIEKIDVAIIGAGPNVTGTLGMDDFTIAGVSTDRVRATVRSANGTLLGGSLPCSWSSTNPSVVDIISSPIDNFVTIETKSAGKATVTVTIDQFEVQLPLTVTMP